MKTNSILIGSDHAGFQQKEFLKVKLVESGFEPIDVGCYSIESVNYPDQAAEVSRGILDGKAENGILICGSGEGMVMAANRFHGIRAGLAWNTEVAGLLKLHNDAQIICLGARFTANEYAWQMVQVFLSASFEGGKHANRIALMDKLG